MAAQLRALTLLVALAALTACASSGGAPAGPGTPVAGTSDAPVPTPEPADHSYSGPLYLADPNGAHPEAGAAGPVVHCSTWGGGGSVTAVPYGDGATTDRPEQALYEEGILNGPRYQFRIAAESDDRALYVLEVDGVVKEAVIVHDGPATRGAGGAGWYVESWAVCDLAEFPRAYTDSIGLQVWTDSTGQPVPTSVIQSWRGPEHCDWQSMIFLTLGKATYVRDPQPGLAKYFAQPYRPHAALPSDAIETGYQHDNDHLWFSADKQLAYVGAPTDVEAWPRESSPLGCD